MTSLRQIFVFGSNLQGRHGAGAAKYALDYYGAIYGQGEGLQGNSYAIPIKRSPYESLSLTEIHGYVENFLKFAEANPDLTFLLTAIGCGFAGHKIQGIAPMFRNAPKNVRLPYIFQVALDGDITDPWDRK